MVLRSVPVALRCVHRRRYQVLLGLLLLLLTYRLVVSTACHGGAAQVTVSSSLIGLSYDPLILEVLLLLRLCAVKVELFGHDWPSVVATDARRA